jgi:hypothetical protein
MHASCHGVTGESMIGSQSWTIRVRIDQGPFVGD